MTSFLTVGIKTRIICEGDTLAEALVEGITLSEAGYLAEGDIIVVAESAVATSEGRIVRLDSVIPGHDSLVLGAKYGIDPRLAEVVRTESDEIIGGIPGHLLCMKGGTLLPNAGVDASNAPPPVVSCCSPEIRTGVPVISGTNWRAVQGCGQGSSLQTPGPMRCDQGAAG